MAQADVTIANVATPSIQRELGATGTALELVVGAYVIAFGALLITGARLGRIHGYRRAFAAGAGVFTGASLLCGLAPTPATLVAARAVQGAGAALMFPQTLTGIQLHFAGAERRRAIGLYAMALSSGAVAGQLLGGALMEATSWRAVFLVNVPIVALALVATARLVRESVDPGDRRLDRSGVVLAVLLLLATTFAFIQAGRSGAGSPAVIVSVAAAVVLLAAFVRVEHRRGDRAMLPLRLFRRAQFSVANADAATMNLGTLGTLFVLTLFLQSTQGRSPLEAGVALVPLFAPLAIIAPFAGRLTSRIGPRVPVAAGLGIAAVGLALLAFAEPGSGYGTLLPAFLLWGIGMGVLTPAVVAAAIGAVPGDRAGLASGINNTARQAGGAIGVAAAGAIAGEPTAGAGFVSGFHAVALGAAALSVSAAVAGATLLPGSR